jgi:hypothetical protein
MSVKTSCQGDGFSTSALPPPRRTGSAAACPEEPCRKAMLVAAPRSGVETRVWPRSDTRSFAFGCSGTRVRRRSPSCALRGSRGGYPKSRSLTSLCKTVVMIVDPPGDPRVSMECPSRATIVRLILLLGRLPPSGELASPGAGCSSYTLLIPDGQTSSPLRRHDKGTAHRSLLPAWCSMPHTLARTIQRESENRAPARINVLITIS